MSATEWYRRLLAGELQPVESLSDEDLLHERSIAKWWSFPIVYARSFGAGASQKESEENVVVARFRALDAERHRRNPPLSAFEAAIASYTKADAKATLSVFEKLYPPPPKNCEYRYGDGSACKKPVANITGQPFCLHHTSIT